MKSAGGRSFLRSKKFLLIRLAAYVLVAVGLVVWVSRTRLERAFDGYCRYWGSIAAKGTGAYDAGTAANKLGPLLNRRGVGFLRERALKGKGEEAAVAVLALDTVLEARHAPQSDPMAVEKILRQLDDLDMIALNDRAAAITANPVVRELLQEHMREALTESASRTNAAPANPLVPLQVSPAPPVGQ